MEVGWLYPGRETCWWVRWQYPGRETLWRLGGCTQVEIRGGGWVAVPRYGDVVGVGWLYPGN